jgi:hypothetical protein
MSSRKHDLTRIGIYTLPVSNPLSIRRGVNGIVLKSGCREIQKRGSRRREFNEGEKRERGNKGEEKDLHHIEYLLELKYILRSRI